MKGVRFIQAGFHCIPTTDTPGFKSFYILLSCKPQFLRSYPTSYLTLGMVPFTTCVNFLLSERDFKPRGSFTTDSRFDTCFVFAWNSRGLRFYQGLEKTVLKLEERLKEFYQTRKKEMAKIEEKEKKAKGDQQMNIVQYLSRVLFLSWGITLYVNTCSCVYHFCD